MGSMAMGAGFGSMASGTGFGTVPPQAEPVAFVWPSRFSRFSGFSFAGCVVMLDAPGKPGHVRQLGVAWCQLVSYENHAAEVWKWRGSNGSGGKLKLEYHFLKKKIHKW